MESWITIEGTRKIFLQIVRQKWKISEWNRTVHLWDLLPANVEFCEHIHLSTPICSGSELLKNQISWICSPRRVHWRLYLPKDLDGLFLQSSHEPRWKRYGPRERPPWTDHQPRGLGERTAPDSAAFAGKEYRKRQSEIPEAIYFHRKDSLRMLREHV